MIIKTKQHNTGLTLVETLVAISVLLVSVIGPMVIYSRSISDARFAGNQITAYYLAQEAMEFVKYKVYTNKNDTSNPGWLDGLNSCINSKCIVDSMNDTLSVCTGVCPSLKIDSGLYNHNSGINTIFTRNIIMVTNNSNEVVITATVSWTNVGVNKTITVKENIFDWQPQK